MKRIFVDDEICTGCRYCEIICSLVHNDVVNPRKSRIRVMSDVFNGVDHPTVCRQCAKPPCADACPVKAIRIDSKLKIPTVNESNCIGCMACVEACPSNGIWFDFDRMVPIKCDLCSGDPKCVKFCREFPHVESSSIMYTTLENWVNKRSQRKSKRSRL